jgi:hypothetical protein
VAQGCPKFEADFLYEVTLVLNTLRPTSDATFRDPITGKRRYLLKREQDEDCDEDEDDEEDEEEDEQEDEDEDEAKAKSGWINDWIQAGERSEARMSYLLTSGARERSLVRKSLQFNKQ